MKPSLKPIAEQVMVVTGASSGIGLATAKAAAAQGAAVVLAARSEDVLAGIADQINSSGGRALAVGADVGKESDVEKISRAALSAFGRIDTWVNNAGVSIWGKLDEVSDADSRRPFDTNFWGVVYGSLEALKYMQRHGGAIINLGSVLSDVSVPVQGMYSATKHAVMGFTDALRMELGHDRAPISVTLIKPAAIDTPYPEHAKNYTGREPKLPDPVYSPDEVARAILHAATHPTREIFVGGGGRVMNAMQHWAPSVMDWVGQRFLYDQQFTNQPAKQRKGALAKGGGDGRVRGNHPGHVMNTSLYTRAAMHPVVTGAAVAGIALAAAALVVAADWGPEFSKPLRNALAQRKTPGLRRGLLKALR